MKSQAGYKKCLRIKKLNQESDVNARGVLKTRREIQGCSIGVNDDRSARLELGHEGYILQQYIVRHLEVRFNSADRGRRLKISSRIQSAVKNTIEELLKHRWGGGGSIKRSSRGLALGIVDSAWMM